MAIWTKSSKTILCQLCYDKQEMQQRAFSFESNNFQWSLPHSHTCLFIPCVSPWGGFNNLEQSYSFSVLLRAQCLCAYMQLRLQRKRNMKALLPLRGKKLKLSPKECPLLAEKHAYSLLRKAFQLRGSTGGHDGTLFTARRYVTEMSTVTSTLRLC